MIARLFISSRIEKTMASEQNIILEIDEALKQERTEKLLKEYGPYILAGIVLAILFTGILGAYRSWNERVNAQQTALLMEAMISEERSTALETLAGQLRPGQRGLALMTSAGSYMTENKPEQALIVLDRVSQDQQIDDLHRDLAHLMAVRLLTSVGKQDVKAEDLLKRLTPLMAEKNPWRWHAHIEAALIKAHMQNDYVAARKHLADVLSQETILPPSLRERAKALNQVYSQKLGQSSVTAPASTSTATDAEG